MKSIDPWVARQQRDADPTRSRRNLAGAVPLFVTPQLLESALAGATSPISRASHLLVSAQGEQLHQVIYDVTALNDLEAGGPLWGWAGPDRRREQRVGIPEPD
jgi:hypothetical protein